MCMVEDGLRHVLKRVKSCTNFSIELHALYVSQMPVHRPDSGFPGDGRPELGQPTSCPESAAWV
jgi:hypothetical protein